MFRVVSDPHVMLQRVKDIADETALRFNQNSASGKQLAIRVECNGANPPQPLSTVPIPGMRVCGFVGLGVGACVGVFICGIMYMYTRKYDCSISGCVYVRVCVMSVHTAQMCISADATKCVYMYLDI